MKTSKKKDPLHYERIAQLVSLMNRTKMSEAQLVQQFGLVLAV
jgi:hypothetical protein